MMRSKSEWATVTFGGGFLYVVKGELPPKAALSLTEKPEAEPPCQKATFILTVIALAIEKLSERSLDSDRIGLYPSKVVQMYL